MNRKEYKEQLLEKIGRKEPVLFAAAGTGLSAKMYDIANVDSIVTTSAGDFVQNGFPSAISCMFYGDANRLNQKVMAEVIVRAGKTPVIAGIGAHDPFRRLQFLLEEWEKQGVFGVTNMPTVCVYDALRRAQLQSGGCGYEEEAQMIEAAAKAGFFTMANVAGAEDALRMCRAGADALVVNCGFTVGGLSGANGVTALTMEEMQQRVQLVVEAVRGIGSDVIVLATGGLLNSPERVQQLFDKTGVQGFLGGSAFERLPIERAVTMTVETYLGMRTKEI